MLAHLPREGRLLHFDSLAPRNARSAQRLGQRLAALRGARAELLDVPCERQRNGYDCGIFAMAHAELLVRTWLRDGSVRAIASGGARVEPLVLLRGMLEAGRQRRPPRGRWRRGLLRGGL